MKLGDFLNTLATNSGIATDDANLIKVLSSPSISAYDIPDEIATKIQEGHLTVESAKANPSIINHFREAHLSRIDKDLYSNLKDLGMEEMEIAELKGVKSTYDKLPVALKKLAELKSKAAAATAAGATGKAAELQTTIDALNKKITDINTQFAAEKASLSQSFDGERKEWVLNNMLAGYEYAGEQPKEVQTQLAKILLQNKLKESNYQTKYDNGNLELITNEGTPVFQNNTKLTLKALTDKLVADNKLIKVSGATPPAQNGAISKPFGTPPANGKSVYDTHLEETMKQFQV